MSSGRTAFKSRKITRLISAILAIYCSTSVVALAQTDSTFSVTRNGVEAKFPFIKIARPEQLKTVANSALPLYSFNRMQYVRIKALLTSFAQMENEYRLLLVNRDKKDSVSDIKEKTMAENVKLEEARAKNFEISYNTLLNVNTQLNDRLKSAEQLAIHEHRKQKLKSILVGALALSTGIIIGVTVW